MSQRRASEYYGSDEGRIKKRQLNAQRNSEAVPKVLEKKPLLSVSIKFHPEVIEYLRQTLSRLDQKPWQRGEVVSFLQEILRQRGLDLSTARGLSPPEPCSMSP